MGSLSECDEVQKLQVLKSRWFLTVTSTLVVGIVTSIWGFHSLQAYQNTVIPDSQLAGSGTCVGSTAGSCAAQGLSDVTKGL
jgi:hypothetical protein